MVEINTQPPIEQLLITQNPYQKTAKPSKKVVCGATTRIGASEGVALLPLTSTKYPHVWQHILPNQEHNIAPDLLQPDNGTVSISSLLRPNREMVAIHQEMKHKTSKRTSFRGRMNTNPILDRIF